MPPRLQSLLGAAPLASLLGCGAPGLAAPPFPTPPRVLQAHKIEAPLLIVQGASDPRVPRSESIQIRDASRKASRRVEYLASPDEGHGLGRPRNRLEFFGHAEAFFAEHIGGRLEK